MKVSIVIPVYNEFQTFPQVLQRVEHAALPPGCTKEVVIIDDGSTDGTVEMLAGVPHYRIDHAGKGSAIREGIARATGDIILMQDGDLEYDPNDYSSILEPIVSGRADIVYGSRFRGARVPMALPNLLANRVLTAVANLLYQAGITDEATAYKAFRISILRQIRLECRRFEFCPEVTAKARRLGFSIDEVPVSYNPRGIAEGKKIRARDGWEALWTLVKWRFAPRRSLRRLDP